MSASGHRCNLEKGRDKFWRADTDIVIPSLGRVDDLNQRMVKEVDTTGK